MSFKIDPTIIRGLIPFVLIRRRFPLNIFRNWGGIVTYSYMQLSGSIVGQLKEELTYTFGKVLDIEVIELDDNDHLAVAFAAVLMRTEGRPIEAVVCLLKRYPDNSASECLLKEVHESQGPIACFCPPRILESLTPTRDIVSLSWRERCRTLRDWEDERWAEQLLADLPY